MRLHYTLPVMEPGPFLAMPESAGRYNSQPDHRVEREEGDFPYFNLHIVASGEGYVEEAGERHLLQKNDAFLYYPNRRQTYYASEDRPWDVYWLHFYGNSLLAEYLTGSGGLRSVVWTLQRSDLMLERMERLIGEVRDRKLLRPSVLSTLTYGIAAEFLAQAIPQRAVRNPEASRAIVRLLPAMQDEACQPFSLEKWAERAGVSTYYFCKLFRKTVQMSPMDFIGLCRIRQAKQLLLDDPSCPVGAVAEACGYPSVSYFIKRFKTVEGVTPAAYRRMHIQ